AFVQFKQSVSDGGRAGHFPAPHKNFQSSQFSTRKPGILSKSDRLRVSNRPSWTRQMAAIFKSIVPQRRRWRFKFSNKRAADSSNGKMVSLVSASMQL